MNSTEPHFYRVNEIFYSLQGEGFHTGTPSVFLRFSGCNRRCPFCDTDFSSFTPMTADDIVSRLKAYPCRRLVVTGGEPLMQLDDTLTVRLHAEGFTIAVETNGSLPVPAGVDWVTCSPKQEPWLIDRIDELKIVFHSSIGDPEDITSRLPETRNMFLQPCSGLNTAETIAYILDHPQWRLSLQTHKLTGIQ